MPKISVDTLSCVGCGLCEQFCPEVFEVQGDGVAHVKSQACGIHNLTEFTQQCPVNAIKVG